MQVRKDNSIVNTNILCETELAGTHIYFWNMHNTRIVFTFSSDEVAQEKFEVLFRDMTHDSYISDLTEKEEEK